jgi:hypothetical protein
VRLGPILLCSLIVSACSTPKPAAAPAPAPTPAAAAAPPQRVVPETVTVTLRDVELERRASRNELRAIEKETQVAELQTRLDDTRDEVVKTMSRLQTLSSRAEAASGIAEAEVVLGTLRTRLGAQHPDVADVAKLVQQASAAFSKSNFGGAFYLASQAKMQAATARTRLGDGRGAPRAGEAAFAVPIRLKVTSRGNVRDGAGTSFGVAFAVESGAVLTAFAWAEDWIRVMDDGGRTGWIYRTLVGRP